LGGIALLLKEKPYQKVLGVLFLVVASLIRFEAALLVMLVVSPVFISDVYKNKRIYLSKTFIYLFICCSEFNGFV
jgi:hypothetical protein